jgi:FkbM family methyltransferase
VLLARTFAGQACGFYIDVGANHPEKASNTKHFSNLGWRGINIEPNVDFSEDFIRFRLRDVNLAIALSDQIHEVDMYFPDDGALATIVSAYGLKYIDSRRNVRRRTVPCRTLADICEEYVGDTTIDFLSIDVEGAEEKVLRGADFSRWRPRVLIIEAVAPNRYVPTHETWESLVTCHGYRYCQFDGVNRYYAAQGELELCARLSWPVCSLDRYLTPEEAELAEYKKLGRVAMAVARVTQRMVRGAKKLAGQ